jgi:hypothetical protein
MRTTFTCGLQNITTLLFRVKEQKRFWGNTLGALLDIRNTEVGVKMGAAIQQTVQSGRGGQK